MKHSLKITSLLSLTTLVLTGCGYLGSRVGYSSISEPTSSPSLTSQVPTSEPSSETSYLSSSVETSSKDSSVPTVPSIPSITSDTSKPTSETPTSVPTSTTHTSESTSQSSSESSTSLQPTSTSGTTATSIEPTTQSSSQPTSQSTSESTATSTESSSSAVIPTSSEEPVTSESSTVIPPTSSTVIPTSEESSSSSVTPTSSTTSHTSSSQPTSSMTIPTPTSTSTTPTPTSQSTSESGITTISVANAITIINGLTKNVPTTEFYYVKGYVTSTVTVGTSGDLKFSIGDSASTSTTIMVYYASSTIGKPVKGDEVIVYGQLEMYNTTKEVVNGVIYSINGSLTTGTTTGSTTQSTSQTTSSSSTSQTTSSSSTSQTTSSSQGPDIPTGDIPAGYYSKVTESMSGSTLQSTLKSIINTSSVSVSYDWSRYEACDQDLDNSSNVLMVYARTSVPKSSHVSGSVGWNREHSFPQSKMATTQAKSDNHVIFASDNKVNGARSNYRLGDLSSQSPNVKDGYGNSTPCKLYDKNGEKFFDPGNTPARGEVARATLYSAVMYDYTITDNFETLAICLEWALTYPVTNRDVYRNDTVYKNQKNRNPFVDHPEYACRIWGTTNSDTKRVCGM